MGDAASRACQAPGAESDGVETIDGGRPCSSRGVLAPEGEEDEEEEEENADEPE